MLTTNSKQRKDTPVYSGVLKYFPLALAAVARVSKAGNDKHNPGEPLHWARNKGGVDADAAARHLLELGTIDPEDGESHDVHLAWRALANAERAEEKRIAAEVKAEARATNTTVGVAWGDPSDVTGSDAMPPPAPKAEVTKPFTYWYLATPYSKYPFGHGAAFDMASRAAALLLEARIPTFCPIAHSHPISMYATVSNTDHEFWINADAPLIAQASGLIVYTAVSWEQSKGMAEEIKRFKAAGKPVEYWAPGCKIPRTVMETAFSK